MMTAPRQVKTKPSSKTFYMYVHSGYFPLLQRYPHTFGMQYNTIGTTTLSWLNETLTLLPEEMRRLGYRTHMVGKWHLGHCHPGLRPMGRGFDTQYGFMLAGHKSYYTHEANGHVYDWWDGDKIDWSAQVKLSSINLLSLSTAVQTVHYNTVPGRNSLSASKIYIHEISVLD